jgi:hypothetical protein
MRNDSRMEMAWRPGATKVGARGPLPSVVRRKRSGFKLSRRRSLAAEVHGPEGEVGAELVPPQRAEAPELLAHRRVPGG